MRAGNVLSLNLHSLIANMWQPATYTSTLRLNSLLNFDKFGQWYQLSEMSNVDKISLRSESSTFYFQSLVSGYLRTIVTVLSMLFVHCCKSHNPTWSHAFHHSNPHLKLSTRPDPTKPTQTHKVLSQFDVCHLGVCVVRSPCFFWTGLAFYSGRSLPPPTFCQT